LYTTTKSEDAEMQKSEDAEMQNGSTEGELETDEKNVLRAQLRFASRL